MTDPDNAPEITNWIQPYPIHQFIRNTELTRDQVEAGYTSSGWYFWDETWAFVHGPHTGVEDVEEAFKKYREVLDAPRNHSLGDIMEFKTKTEREKIAAGERIDMQRTYILRPVEASQEELDKGWLPGIQVTSVQQTETYVQGMWTPRDGLHLSDNHEFTSQEHSRLVKLCLSLWWSKFSHMLPVSDEEAANDRDGSR